MNSPLLSLDFEFEESKLSFTFSHLDSSSLGYSVFNLDSISIDSFSPQLSLSLRQWLTNLGREFPRGLFLTGRLTSSESPESQVLQKAGFYFTELTLHPRLLELERKHSKQKTLHVAFAKADEVLPILDTHGQLFSHSRYHTDPNIENALADKRFNEWILRATDNPSQEVLLIRKSPESEPIALFVQSRSGDTMNWDLTAVLPNFRGKGLADIVWKSVLSYNAFQGISSVSTQISAENVRTIPLYVKNGFQISRASVSLHFFSGAQG